MEKVKFKGSYYNFWVEDIFPSYSDKCYIVSVIPNINSTFFPPYHLRYIKISPELLEKEDFEEIERDLQDSPFKDKKYDFVGSVKQGHYYEIDPLLLQNKKLFCSLKADDNYNSAQNDREEALIIDKDNDIFKKSSKKSPYDISNIKGKYYVGYNDLHFYQKDKLDFVYLYCFNVGQGDCFLLIPSSANPYIIDLNISNNKKINNCDLFIEKIRKILFSHGLDKDYIKGLIITHKHIDHLRGAWYFINNGRFRIDNFLINEDYDYTNKQIFDLYNSAKSIEQWKNVNIPGVIFEGSTTINIVNPDTDTKNRNLNNSSIALNIQFKNNKLFMTGDAGITVLKDKYSKEVNNKTNNFLKVSHHGSNSGTNRAILNLLNPKMAFISAGNNRNYGHPHNDVLNVIREFGCDLEISKCIGKDLCYCFNGEKIYCSIIE